jgi:hypothetical protein
MDIHIHIAIPHGVSGPVSGATTTVTVQHGEPIQDGRPDQELLALGPTDSASSSSNKKKRKNKMHLAKTDTPSTKKAPDVNVNQPGPVLADSCRPSKKPRKATLSANETLTSNRPLAAPLKTNKIISTADAKNAERLNGACPTNDQSNSQPKADSASKTGKKTQKKKKKKKKPEGPPLLRISKEMIEASPWAEWNGPVQLLETLPEMRQAVHEILASGETHLGFDMETKPVFQKHQQPRRPALLQLATSSKVYLFRLCFLHTDRNLKFLLPIFTSPRILKTGEAIHDDVKDLQRYISFQPAGFVDTASSVTRPQLHLLNGGLRALAAYFGIGRLSDNMKLTLSNWEAAVLNEGQLSYAVIDAFVSREIHVRALAMVKASTAVSGTGRSLDGVAVTGAV